MATTISDALKEAYASAPINNPILETIRLIDSASGPLISMVRDRAEHTLTLETSEDVLFEPVGFVFSLPAKSDKGLQELNLEIDNVDRRISEFVRQAAASSSVITAEYRPYLADDTSTPQWSAPLVLTLRDLRINVHKVSGKATFADIINKPFASELYTRGRFPSLGG